MAENVVDKEVRKRGANFSKGEKQTLLAIVEKYRNIVECKKTDAVSSKQKLQAWDEICQIFNAKSSPLEHRPANRLKVLSENIKRNTRKQMSTLRQETFKTGGGSNPVKEDPVCLQVKEIIGNTAVPMENAYDNDALSIYNEVTGSFGEIYNLEDVNSGEELLPETEESSRIVVESAEASVENETLGDHIIQEKDWSQWKPIMLKTQKSPALRVHSNSASTLALAEL